MVLHKRLVSWLDNNDLCMKKFQNLLDCYDSRIRLKLFRQPKRINHLSLFKGNNMSKYIYQIPLLIFFFILFIICLSPAFLIKITTGNIDNELYNLYWERRMQAIALFVGVGLIIGGLCVIKKRQMKIKLSCFKMKREITLTDKNAFLSGTLVTGIGILATLWSLPFWCTYVIPVIFKK